MADRPTRTKAVVALVFAGVLAIVIAWIGFLGWAGTALFHSVFG